MQLCTRTWHWESCWKGKQFHLWRNGRFKRLLSHKTKQNHIISLYIYLDNLVATGFYGPTIWVVLKMQCGLHVHRYLWLKIIKITQVIKWYFVFDVSLKTYYQSFILTTLRPIPLFHLLIFLTCHFRFILLKNNFSLIHFLSVSRKFN